MYVAKTVYTMYTRLCPEAKCDKQVRKLDRRYNTELPRNLIRNNILKSLIINTTSKPHLVDLAEETNVYPLTLKTIVYHNARDDYKY